MLRLILDFLHFIAASAFTLLGVDYDNSDECGPPVKFQEAVYELPVTEVTGELTQGYFIETPSRPAMNKAADCAAGTNAGDSVRGYRLYRL